MLTELYEYYVEYPEAMSTEYRELIVRGEKKEQAVCDYLSGMTDQYSIRKFREIYIPKSMGSLLIIKKEDEACVIQTISLKKSG